MTDLTNQVFRQYIYQDRNELEDFDIHNTSTMDGVMFKRISESMIIDLPGASQYILGIMNNVYYITILILMDDTAITHKMDYIKIAEHAGSAYKDITLNNTYGRYFECITMAMVCNYLYIIDSKKYSRLSDNTLINYIWDYHHIHFNDDQPDGKARSLFFNNFMQHEDILTLYVRRDAFKPLKSKEELKSIDKELRAIQGEDNMQSDFDKIKDYHFNQNLDYYLSEEHWNFHVNSILYKKLLIFHEGKEVGAYLDTSGDSFTQPIRDYTSLYGNMFNEAYRLCNVILTTPVPQKGSSQGFG